MLDGHVWDKENSFGYRMYPDKAALTAAYRKLHEDVYKRQDLAEERRLFYVGITRARDELILTYPGEPSPFLAEIPSGAVTSLSLIHI